MDITAAGELQIIGPCGDARRVTDLDAGLAAGELQIYITAKSRAELQIWRWRTAGEVRRVTDLDLGEHPQANYRYLDLVERQDELQIWITASAKSWGRVTDLDLDASRVTDLATD